MGWKHIVMEGYCFFHSDEEEDKKIPEFCINGPDDIGLHCIEGCEGGNTRCPYFAFGKARSSVIVTDEEGKDFACDGFYIEDAYKLSDSEYLKKEKEWIDRWSEKINHSIIESNEDLSNYEYEVWIEEEECKEHKNDITKDNTDVVVEFEDGTRFWASFFTYDNINWLREKNVNTGECLNGKYFWSSDLIIVDKISRSRIEEIIKHLIKTNEFRQIFRYYPKKD